MSEMNIGDTVFIELNPALELDEHLMDKYPLNLRTANSKVYLLDTVSFISKDMIKTELHPYGFKKSEIITAAEFKKLNHRKSKLIEFLNEQFEENQLNR